jgi:hypothetical protein
MLESVQQACFLVGGQRLGLMSVLDKETIEDVAKIDIGSLPYTYIFPKLNSDGSLYIGTNTNEIQILITIIKSLKSSPKPVRLNPTEYEVFKRIMSPHFNELRNLIQNYIFSNNKSIVDKIKSLMTPEDREAMINSIQSVKKVYRGIGWNGQYRTEKNIREDEIKSKYVSTTPNLSVANRFTRGAGHLENDSVNRNEHRAILTYDISNKNSVILSTTIFGEAFDETDILIDATVAKLIEVERL